MGSRIKESPGSTFEVYMEVVHSGTAGSGPEVRRSFPDTYADQETLQTIPKFCFPFNMDSMSVGHVGQNFTFVLTDIESKQRFGFCRLSSGAHSCHCILSYLPWFEVFYKLLNILADYSTKGQDSQWRELLESLHVLNIPVPGVPVHLSVHLFFTVPDPRELPSIPENRNLTEYFVAVDVNNMLHLYASMLYERRILISCSKLSTLTACVHGAAAMLYPMFWQHVYIPVLPQHLIDYCCAPMPYLIGVHSSLMEKVRGMALDDVVLLNVDTNTLETPFDDLQNLPNDVVSSLKNRLRKVSSTTGDGVARAFLKAQAALFGSYRNALHIEPEEPITFSEETFITHRSSTMRQFLQNAIQLQFFKQFIDGRLELLNSGEGFSDQFEEEINIGEYAGSDKTYQWLFTVKKGSGAILNTVKTKANPAMKTVYKFAKDHAKMGIKEVKSRLKQKELAENGYSEEPGSTNLPSTHSKDSLTWDQRRPITVHFGQARPPRPLVAKRPRSNIGVEGSPEHYVRPTRHYTVFLCEDSSGDELSQDDDSVAAIPEHFMLSAPFEWPQPYRSLKEAELVEEGEEIGERFQGNTAPSSPVLHKFSDLSLLQDAFRSQQGESECTETTNTTKPSLSTHSTISSARSLEELRADPKHANFNYQRMDLSSGERTRTLPGLKTTNPYSKLWSQLEDPSMLLGRESLSWERPLSVPPLEPHEARPPSRDSSNPSGEKTEGACITIPRPQGRKTPEPGAVLAPAVTLLRGVKQVCEKEGGGSTGGQEFRQALNMSPHSQAQTQADLLKPNEEQGLDLLSLLDPLCGTMKNEGAPSLSKPPIPPRPNPSNLPAFPPPVSLNPFTQQSQYPPQRHYSPVAPGNPFTPAYMPSPGANYFPTSARPFSVYGQASAVVVTPTGGLWSTGRVPPSSSSSGSLSSLLDSPAPATLAQPAQVSTDPFSDLLTMATTPTVMATPPPKKVEDLRRRWETFD
ncbi:DENN domain-containing protein 1A isoform X2 [Pimephales promelas]|uniref:DENN domain-containing protein 1A isoform X2 n=1 Tax=Pimephales promelas TaxID=90988 RepID=UPI001955BB33|nr:DENN domain-containing protein 1A isoform X2 [Pimephales promelas]KAG1942132.1 DENN domain-containing protein 1A [Pimephales promelas]